jgi:hypothetical protein
MFCADQVRPTSPLVHPAQLSMMKDHYSVLLLKPMNDKHYTKTFLIDSYNHTHTYPLSLGSANPSQATGKCHLPACTFLDHFGLSW